MEIKPKPDKILKNISITNSYAPHRGYTSNEINDYWLEINQRCLNLPNKTLNGGALTIMAK